MANEQKNGGGFNIGSLLKGIGVIGASALIPGFGTGFAESRSAALKQKAEADARRQDAAFKMAQIAAESGDEAGIQALAPSLDSQLAEAFSGVARRNALMRQEQQAALAELRGRAGGGDGGEFETGFNVTPEGKISQRFSPPSAGTRRLRGEEGARKRVLELQKDFIERQGFSPQEAHIAAVQTASREGKPIPQEWQPFLQVGEPQAPTSGAVPDTSQFVPPGQSFEAQAGGQAPAAVSAGVAGATAPQPGEGLATRKSRAALGVPIRATAKERETFSSANAAFEGLENISGLVARNAGRIGPVRGRAGSLGENFGLNPREFTQLKAALEKFAQQARFALTGAQASQTEIAAIEKTFPRVSDTPEQFQARLIETLKSLQQRLSAYEGSLQNQNVISPGLKIPAPLRKMLEEEATRASAAPQGTGPTGAAPPTAGNAAPSGSRIEQRPGGITVEYFD